MIINTLPSPTWRWLNLNETKIEDVTFSANSGIKEELSSISKKEDNTYVSEGKGCVKLKVHLAPEASDEVTITAPEGDETCVFEVIEGSAENKFSRFKTTLNAKAGSTLRLIQVILNSDGSLLNNICGTAEDNAQIKIIQLFLGDGNNYTDYEINLDGKKSSLTTNICYTARENQVLDMNYLINHRGVKTESLLSVNGVLYEGAKKIFRGTIDMKNGCHGSKGAETEDVLILGDKITNKTIPVILCDEEDVEGSHGATIGRLNEDLIFYLNSRGIATEDAAQIMAESRIDSTLSLIGDEDVIHEVNSYLGRTAD